MKKILYYFRRFFYFFFYENFNKKIKYDWGFYLARFDIINKIIKKKKLYHLS